MLINRFSIPSQLRYFHRTALFLGCAVVLSGCASEDYDDTTGSRLVQAPAGSPPRQAVEVNDIAIVGQEAAHAILNLSAVATAPNPPLVQFNGVTSIVVGKEPVDTGIYTQLFRDRLLIITREKLRFIERTLPRLNTAKKAGKKNSGLVSNSPTDPEYQILAELRGKEEDKFYRIQVQFVSLKTGEVLFDGLYRIRKEAPAEPYAGQSADGAAPAAAAPADTQ